MTDGETDELLEQQQQRAEREEKLAEQAEGESEEAEHRRRAEKARYLESKLQERESPGSLRGPRQNQPD